LEFRATNEERDGAVRMNQFLVLGRWSIKIVPRIMTVLFDLAVSRLAFRPNRRNWARFINGRTVCVVGPSPLARDFQEEVEAHDIIIRVGAEHWPWVGTGSRTDVWVLDQGGTRDFIRMATNSSFTVNLNEDAYTSSLVETIHEASSDRVPWILFKGGTRISLREFLAFVPSKQLGSFNPKLVFARKPIFSALRGLHWRASVMNLTQVNLVLLELFLLRPKKVSVYGSDYYTRPGLAYGAGSPSYEKQKADGPAFIERMLRVNPLHQRQVVRWVRSKRGWPGGDPDFIELTEMDDEAFVKLLNGWREN